MRKFDIFELAFIAPIFVRSSSIGSNFAIVRSMERIWRISRWHP